LKQALDETVKGSSTVNDGSGEHTMEAMNPAQDIQLPTVKSSWPPLTASYTDEDLPLVHASKDGDLSAFEQLVKRHERRLLRVAQNVTHDIDEAQDVVQETFLKAYLNLAQFRKTARFSTWLVRIALNESLMRVRKPRISREVLAEDIQIELENAPSELRDWAPNPEELCSAVEFREILRDSLEKLTPILRVVFVLRDIEELSINETAEVLGLSTVTVRARLFRARLQLRDKLSKHFAKHDGGLESLDMSFRPRPNTDFDKR
jgi:RNA polymerase sigma-70 factor, ECF subfamily